MSNVYKFPRQDQRYDEASEWIAKLDRDLSGAEQQDLREWMSDKYNRAVLLEMAKLWDQMTVLSRLSDLVPEPATQPRRSPGFALAAAASVLVTVLATIWLASSLDLVNVPDAGPVVSAKQMDADYETAIGEQSTVSLADGTQVVLNTNTRIGVKYTDQYRLVTLTRGEIHVQVAPDKARPLRVIVGDRIVQAVGTAFSLEITNDDQIELIVTEGKVLVALHQGANSDTAEVAPAPLSSSPVTVAAGERVDIGSPNGGVVQVSTEEIEVKLSWRKGTLIFRGESLQDAMAEIGRYTTVEFVILDEKLKETRIAGLFRAGDIEGLLVALRENFDITNQRTADGKILLTSL
jgi:transmembrane sensor